MTFSSFPPKRRLRLCDFEQEHNKKDMAGRGGVGEAPMVAPPPVKLESRGFAEKGGSTSVHDKIVASNVTAFVGSQI